MSVCLWKSFPARAVQNASDESQPTANPSSRNKQKNYKFFFSQKDHIYKSKNHKIEIKCGQIW